MDWGDFIQQSAGKVLDATIEREYKAPVEMQRMQMMQYGPYGQPYNEGIANTPTNGGGAPAAIPMQWLLIAGVIALVVMAD